MGEIKITLESLYDILRNEKKREDLQKLEETFFLDVVYYLKEKQVLLESKKEDSNIFAAGEKDKFDYELRSIKRILKQIYELREKKIIDIALNRSRTGSDIIDTSSMLKTEVQFYQETLGILDHFRKGILMQIFKGELPEFIKEKISTRIDNSEERNIPASTTIPLKNPSVSTSNTITTISNTITPPPPNTITTTPTHSPVDTAIVLEKTKVKFLNPVPRFIWKDMKEYGPFNMGEHTEIFPEVADLLVRKGRAVKV